MRYMVFDVESIGLHGEGFAVGWVIIDNFMEIDARCVSCDPHVARGGGEGRRWVQDNVPALTNLVATPRIVRDVFWKTWEYERARGTILAADCPWPVEARFLIDCVADDPGAREWSGPYPLIDIGSVIHAMGMDAVAEWPRLDSELPKHDPMRDARQSARLLMEYGKNVTMASEIRKVER